MKKKLKKNVIKNLQKKKPPKKPSKTIQKISHEKNGTDRLKIKSFGKFRPKKS